MEKTVCTNLPLRIGAVDADRANASPLRLLLHPDAVPGDTKTAVHPLRESI